MRLRLNNELRKFSLSSKNINFGEFQELNDNVQKVNMDRSFGFHDMNNVKKLSYSPPVNQNFYNNMEANEAKYRKSKKLANNCSFIYPSLKKKKFNNTFLFFNHRNKENILDRSRATLQDGLKRARPPILNSVNQSLYDQSPQTNLKIVQKELQFKLLDMSIQIENGIGSDDDDSSYFSNLKTDNNKVGDKNLKNEIESPKVDIYKINRRKSVNVNDTRLMDSFSNFYNFNRGQNNLSKSIIYKQLNKSKLNKGNNSSFLNINSFRNDLSKNAINLNKSLRRKSFNLNRNYKTMMNMNRLSSGNVNKNNLSMNWGNKSMSTNRNNISMNRILNANNINIEFENKYRLLLKQKELYDSYEDEEVIEELDDEYFFISPEKHTIFIFDTFILLCNLFCCFYYPLHIAQSICFCSYFPDLIKHILFFTDIINIFDILLSFFRAYYNFEYSLIKKTDKIIIHYLKKYFFTDLISAIPVFTCSFLLCKNYKPDGDLCFENGIDLKYNFLKMSLGLRIIKVFKILDKKANRGIEYFHEFISENYTLEKTMKMILFIIICIMAFNIFICYHIYIGRQTYPNWILATNNQDKKFLELYMISCYFMITTVTSVGYGDITCESIGETIFQIIVLTVGVIAYSWIVSTIGNYVKNETKAAIKYNKDIELLEEIRVSYPKMPFKLYNKIQKHLEVVSHQQERFDTNLLVNNLPYTLKNQLMFIIYDTIIKKFNFFKECENSDFILRILTSFIPLSAKKGAFIIHEGELVDNIVFVKEGRLSLVAAIDLDNPISSIDNYLGNNFEDINEKMETKLDNSMMMNKSINNLGLKIEKAQTEIKTLLKTKDDLNDSNIEQEIGKCDFDGDDFDVGNHQFLNILDILKNEHYGEVYMFLQKPSPLSLRVKSKYSQLFLLKKHQAMQISKAYPNVWKKIYRKSYHNMKSIKSLTKRIVIHYCNNYGHKYDSSQNLDDVRIEPGDNFIRNLGILNGKRRETRKKTIQFNFEDSTTPKNNLNFPKPQKTILKNKLERLKTIENNRNNSFIEEDNNSIYNKSNLKETKILTENNRGLGININNGQIKKLKTLSQYAKFENEPNKKQKFSRTSSINQNPELKNNLVANNNIFINNNNFINNLNRNSLGNIHRNSNNNLNRNSIGNIHRNSNSNLQRNSFGYINRNSNGNINKNTLGNINNIRSSNFKNNSTTKFKKVRVSNSSLNIEEDDDKTIVLNNSQNNEENNNNINNSPFIQLHSNVEGRSNSLYFKSKEKNDLNVASSISFKNKPPEKMLSLRINESNLQDSKINQGSNLKNSIITQRVDTSEVVQKPNTIKNLSRPLIKKIEKKIKKRRRKKKLYKMLVSKISESLIRLNPNANISLNSSINNSFVFLPRTDIVNNNQFPYALQNSSYISHDNSGISDKNEMNEGVTQINGQELLIIPESPEFNSEEEEEEESSSENSKNSNETVKKKKIELSISENFNFSYSMTYENLNSISKGNYSKDENLRKSVIKLIGVYLKEKTKNKNNPVEKNESIENSKNRKEKEKDKDKEKEYKYNTNINNKKEKGNNSPTKKEDKEKDVWAFLNDDEEEENKINFKLDSSKSKESSSEENKNNFLKLSKSTKPKKSADFSASPKYKSKFKKNEFHFFIDNEKAENASPKNKKKRESIKKKGGGKARKESIIKLKKCTTIINPKKKKKGFMNDDKFKSNNNLKLECNSPKKARNSNSVLSSLDLTIDEQQDSYIKNFYKHLRKKKSIEEDIKNDSKVEDISNKNLSIK